MACFDEQQQEIPCSQWYVEHAIRVAETNQTGTQYWMNADYNLTPETEPSLAIKKAYSDAQYAYNQIPALIAHTGTLPSQVVNPNVQQILNQQQNSPLTSPFDVLSDIKLPDLSGITTWLYNNWQLIAGVILFIVVILPMITGSISRSARGARG